MRHQSATVFVDDYIVGRTPDICAITGRSTSDRLTVSTEIDRPSPAWFLLLLAPLLGWFILAFVLATARRTYLTGSIAVSADAWRALRRRRHHAMLAMVGGVTLLIVVAAWVDVARGAGALLALVLIVGGIVALALVDARSPKVHLDATRRWVTITRVHAQYAAAVAAAAMSDEVGDRGGAR